MKSTLIQTPEFATDNMWLAASLATLGITFKTVEPTDENGKQAFVFENSEKIQELEDQYNTGKMLVDPKALFHNYKALISIAKRSAFSRNRFA